MISQSNAINVALILVGTTSLFLSNQSNSSKLLPSKSYTYAYEQKQELNTYLLYHEIMPDSFENTIMELLVEMPIIKSIRAKFNKPTLLQFACIEDDEGFIV